MILTVLLTLAAARAELADPTPVDRDSAVSLGSQRLRWPAGTRVAVSESAGEVVIRYDAPLPAATIDALRAGAPAAIDDLRWNDDSLVLRASAGWRIGWLQDGDMVSLTFLRANDAADVADTTGDPAELEVALTAIEADAAAGYPGQARRAAERLARRHPDDPRVLRKLADARSGEGDVRGAAEVYRRIGATDRAARRARAFAPGAASVSAVARDGGDLSQLELSARADVAIDDRVSVGGGVRHIASRVDVPAGRVTAQSQVIDGGVTVRLDDDIRATLLAASALDTGVTGGGIRLVAGSTDLQVRAGLSVHLPDYSTGPQALADGYLTRATLGGGYRVTPGLYAQGDIGWNRYGLAGTDTSSDTITLSGGLDYLIRRGSPSVTLGYRIDAEYVQTDRSTALTLADRENHTLQGIVSAAIRQVQVTGQLGYTVDRFGGDGPNAGIGVSTAIGDGWRLDGGGGYTSISRTGFDGRQLYGRAQLTRGLGGGR